MNTARTFRGVCENGSLYVDACASSYCEKDGVKVVYKDCSAQRERRKEGKKDETRAASLSLLVIRTPSPASAAVSSMRSSPSAWSARHRTDNDAVRGDDDAGTRAWPNLKPPALSLEERREWEENADRMRPARIRARKRYRRTSTMYVQGRQGICTDGGKTYWHSDTKALYMIDIETGQILVRNDSPFDDLPRPGNHIGDIALYRGRIYAGVELFEYKQFSHLQLVQYDMRTLIKQQSLPLDPESGQKEISALAIDQRNDVIWTSDWSNGQYLYKYALSSGTYLGKMRLLPAPYRQQGLAFVDFGDDNDSVWNDDLAEHERDAKGAWLYITADDGDAMLHETDNLYKVRADAKAEASRVTHVQSFDEFEDYGEIEGIDIAPGSHDLIVLHNRGLVIDNGLPTGELYPKYQEELHEVYRFEWNISDARYF